MGATPFPLAWAQNLDGLIARADSFSDRGELSQAVATLKQAEKLNSDVPEVQWRLARLYSRQIIDTPDQAAKKRLATESFEYATRAVAGAPNNSEAHVTLAIAYGKMTDFVNTRIKIEYSRLLKREADRSLELNPNNDFGHHVLGRWNFEMAGVNPLLRGVVRLLYGKIPAASREEGIRHLEIAVKLAPDVIPHHAELASVLERVGRKEEALAQWRTVSLLKAVDTQDREYQREAAARLGAGSSEQ
jgi:tetratricopeptide (TPR) repeat protein